MQILVQPTHGLRNRKKTSSKNHTNPPCSPTQLIVWVGAQNTHKTWRRGRHTKHDSCDDPVIHSRWRFTLYDIRYLQTTHNTHSYHRTTWAQYSTNYTLRIIIRPTTSPSRNTCYSAVTFKQNRRSSVAFKGFDVYILSNIYTPTVVQIQNDKQGERKGGGRIRVFCLAIYRSTTDEQYEEGVHVDLTLNV